MLTYYTIASINQISRQLDALSHFHFTPRPVVPESRVSTLNPHAGAGAAAVSSLLLEDVTPATAQGSISQLAPEEVRFHVDLYIYLRRIRDLLTLILAPCLCCVVTYPSGVRQEARPGSFPEVHRGAHL